MLTAYLTADLYERCLEAFQRFFGDYLEENLFVVFPLTWPNEEVKRKQSEKL